MRKAFNLFPANIPFLDKPFGWFLLAKCVKKHLWKSGILSKDASHRLTSLIKMSPFRSCFFTNFACKIQVAGFFIHETLAGNGLIIIFVVWTLTKEQSVTVHWVFDLLFYREILNEVERRVFNLLSKCFSQLLSRIEIFQLLLEFQIFNRERHDICLDWPLGNYQ